MLHQKNKIVFQVNKKQNEQYFWLKECSTLVNDKTS